MAVLAALPLPVAEAAALWGTLAIALAALAAALAVTAALWPAVLLRALTWLAARSLYRIRVVGLDHLPRQGGVLLVCNPVTSLDWLLLATVCPRRIRFLVHAPGSASKPSRLLQGLAALPLDSTAGTAALVPALHAAARALADGEAVCLFAEGLVAPDGSTLPYHAALDEIRRHAPPVPIVPVSLDQLYGSLFTVAGGRLRWKRPRRIPSPVTVSFAAPLPSDTHSTLVRQAIQGLSAADALVRAREILPAHRQFVRTAARHPFRPCFFDPLRPAGLSYGRVLAGVLCLLPWLRPRLADAPMVGVWLPPGVGSACVNIALALLRRTAVNLNYSAPPEDILVAIRECDLRTVITSQRFLDRIPLSLPPGVEMLRLEPAAQAITRRQQLVAFLKVLLLPGWVLDRLLHLGEHSPDDLATVIFSSGSTGEPKGVMLTHGNVAANALSVLQAIHLTPEDRLLGVLPLFHSFGYTVTLWTALEAGASAVYYPDPRAAPEIGAHCKKYRCTLFVSTPTFLRFCTRRCEPDAFASLHTLICGAEKMPPSVAADFHKKFGVLPLEGYGCTELSPVVSTNLPARHTAAGRLLLNKTGTIGQPLPGIAVKVEHPDRPGEEMPPGEEGELLVTGANVMKGYLHQPVKTGQVIRDGWYTTGDMARLDEDGFIIITGRKSRFAKVAGEMVPLERLETELQHLVGTTERVLAVTCVPDPARGERVVVLYTTLDGTDPHRLNQALAARGLASLWIPHERDYYSVPEIPILGSGKVDLRRLRELALERNSHR